MGIETCKKYGDEFVYGHEITEDMLTNHTEQVIDQYSNLLEK